VFGLLVYVIMFLFHAPGIDSHFQTLLNCVKFLYLFSEVGSAIFEHSCFCVAL